MYAVAKRQQSPSAIEHCVRANLTSPAAVNLVVAKNTTLEVYTVRSKLKAHEDTKKRVARLDLVAEYQLFGNIKSLGVARRSNAPDLLVVGLAEAKVTVLDWDASVNQLRIVSMHYYENDPDIRGGYTHFFVPNTLEVDFESRCAVYLIYDRCLAVVPLLEGITDPIVSSSTAAAATAPENGETSTTINAPKNAKNPHKFRSASYVIRLAELNIHTVRDVKFLHGYYEPTVMVLYEITGTWAGRLPKRSHTMGAAIISLNLNARMETLVWSMDKLPCDAYKIVALPDYLGGGALIFGVNEILSVSQSSQYRLTLNHFGDSSRQDDVSFKGAPSKVTTALECAKCTFLTEEAILITLGKGELYVLTVLTDGRSVTRLDLERVGASVVASCICTLTPELAFLGSSVGDSMLIKYTEIADDSSLAAKRRRRKKDIPLDASQVITDADIIDQIDRDRDVEQLISLMIQSGNFITKDTRVTRFALSVADTLEACAPFTNLFVIPAFDRGSQDLNNEYYAKTHRRQSDLVGCSGQNKQGALTIIHQAIRPFLVTALELPSCVGLWSVRLKQAATEAKKSYHKYLIIGTEFNTMVLEAGETLAEITDTVNIRVDLPTLNVGTVCDETRLIQINFSGVYFLEGVNAIAGVQFDEGKHVVWSSICDPFVLVLLNDGSIEVYQASDPQSFSSLISAPHTPEASIITACCLFKDQSQALGFNKLSPSSQANRDSLRKSTSTGVDGDSMVVNQDEDDLAMLEDPEETQLYKTSSSARPKSSQNEDHFLKDGEEITRPVYLAISRLDGSIEIYELPGFDLVFFAPGLALGRHLLTHNMEDSYASPNPALAPCVVELQFVDLGGNFSMPHLVAILDNGEIYIYKSFYHLTRTAQPTDIPVRFSRVEHGVITRHLSTPDMGWAGSTSAATASSAATADPSLNKPDGNPPKKTPPIPATKYPPLNLPVDDDSMTRIISSERKRSYWPRIVAFDDIADRRGAFISGPRALWIVAEREAVRCFPMDSDSTVGAFTSFHNVNCEQGFIYYTTNNRLKISQLNPALSLDFNLPLVKVPLKATPHSFIYDAENEVLAVMVSASVKKMVRFLKPAGDDRRDRQREEEMIERGEDPTKVVYNEADVPPRMPVIYDSQYELRIISPETWEQSDTIKLNEEEVGVVTSVAVKTQDKEDGPEKVLPFVVVAATLLRSEDAAPKSRVLVYEFFKESSEGQRPQAKLNLLVEKEEKGVISSLNQIANYVAVCLATRINLYQLVIKRELVPVAFMDVQMMVVSMTIIKNFVLVSDIYKSVYFMRWKESAKNLFVLGKDFEKMEVYAANYLVDNDKLSVVVSDESQHIHLYTYEPKVPQSLKGQRLLNVGNYHIGTRVSCFVRLKLNRLNFAIMGNQSTKYGVMYGGVDGSLGKITPINAERFKMLGKLEMRLVSAVHHFAGLNPKSFRLWKPKARILQNHQRRVVDGDLLCRFLFLDREQQDALAQQVGHTTDEILDSLIELDLAARFF